MPNLITLFLLLSENELVGNFCARTVGVHGVPGLHSSAGKVRASTRSQSVSTVPRTSPFPELCMVESVF